MIPARITSEDMARWPEETRVMVDAMLEHGVDPVDSSLDVDVLLLVKTGQCGPYRMVDREGRPSMFGLETYEAWAGNSAVLSPPLTAELLEKYLRQEIHRNCPMLGCEDFDMRQALVPAPFLDQASRVAYRLVSVDHGERSLTFSATPHIEPGSVAEVQSADRTDWYRYDGDVFTQITWSGPPEGRDKLRWQREHLRNARPQRRLDGQRRR